MDQCPECVARARVKKRGDTIAAWVLCTLAFIGLGTIAHLAITAVGHILWHVVAG